MIVTHRIAIVVDSTLPLGLLANTVATIAIGLGAAVPAFGNTILIDANGRSTHNSADRPVPILQASAEAIRVLLLSLQRGLELDPVFTDFAQLRQ